MSKQRIKGLDEFRTCHLNLTDEEFTFLVPLIALAKPDRGMLKEPFLAVQADLLRKLDKAWKFLRTRNHAIQQRKAALAAKERQSK